MRRGGASLLVLSATSAVLIAILLSDVVTVLETTGEPRERGWNVVAGRWILRRLGLGLATAGGLAATTRGARGWKPLRNVVWLEVSSPPLHDRDLA